VFRTASGSVETPSNYRAALTGSSPAGPRAAGQRWTGEGWETSSGLVGRGMAVGWSGTFISFNASDRECRSPCGVDKVLVRHHLTSGGVAVGEGRSRPQNRQTMASALIVSAQNGHFFVGSGLGLEEGEETLGGG